MEHFPKLADTQNGPLQNSKRATVQWQAQKGPVPSATYASFIDQSTGRFIKPGIPGGRDEACAAHERVDLGGSGGGDGTDELGLDPLLIALLKKVPSPDKGWPGPQRIRWFRTFAMNVSQIYDGDGEPIEMKIEQLEGGPK